MGQGGFGRGGSEHGRIAPRVQGTGDNTTIPHTLKLGGGEACDMFVSRLMSGPRSDGWQPMELVEGYGVGPIQYINVLKFIGVIYHWFARLRAWLFN